MIKLPDVDFFDNDPQQIISDVKYTYETMLDKEIQESSPEFLFISTMAAWIVLVRQQYDAALKQNLLYYATFDKLDHLGAFRDTPRLDAQGSKTTLEFTLSSARPSSIVIPRGTRATADSTIFFATDDVLIIPAGTTSGRITATSIQTGNAANNIPVGSINIIVDPVPGGFVSDVSNIDISLGGRDVEDDESYRDRIYNAPSVFSIAGPRNAYIYLTKAVNSSIGEVTVNSPTPGVVKIYPLLIGGDIPNTAILSEINTALNKNTVRPLTDNVYVEAPSVVNYSINLTYYIGTEDSGDLDNISTAVNNAVDNWILWQRLKIGRDINVTELITRVRMAGAKRVTVNSPSFTVIQDNQLAVCDAKNISFGGLEDE